MAKIKRLSKADTNKATDAANSFAAVVAKILSSESKVRDLDNFGNMLTYSKYLRVLAFNAAEQNLSPLHLLALGVFVAGIEHEAALEETERSNQKMAILCLNSDDDGGVLCQAFDPPNGELQPEQLPDDSVVGAYMPPSDTEEGDIEAEMQCVRSVLGNLGKLGYSGAVLWKWSEVEPAWIKKMLKKWNPVNE